MNPNSNTLANVKVLQGSRFHQLITDQTEVSTKTSWLLFLSRTRPPPLPTPPSPF